MCVLFIGGQPLLLLHPLSTFSTTQWCHHAHPTIIPLPLRVSHLITPRLPVRRVALHFCCSLEGERQFYGIVSRCRRRHRRRRHPESSG